MAQTPAQRRAAQRRLARQIATGTYTPGPAGRAYRAAINRLTGLTMPGNMGTAGWVQSMHATLGGAIRKAGSLPDDAHVVILARGVLPPVYAAEQAAERGWLALHPAAAPEWYRNPDRQRQLAAAAEARFDQPPTRYSVVWLIR